MTPGKAFLSALALLAAVPAATQEARAPAPPPTARTTMIGRSDHEVILAKIAVTDLVRSYWFYTEVVGLKLASPMLQPPAASDPEKDFVEYPLNFTGSLAEPFFVITRRRGQVVTPAGAANTTVGFKVPSAAAAVARAKAAGASVVREPGTPASSMAFGMIRDPDGYNVEFVQAAAFPAR